jgi:hypothetical protein
MLYKRLGRQLPPQVDIQDGEMVTNNSGIPGG